MQKCFPLFKARRPRSRKVLLCSGRNIQDAKNIVQNAKSRPIYKIDCSRRKNDQSRCCSGRDNQDAKMFPAVQDAALMRAKCSSPGQGATHTDATIFAAVQEPFRNFSRAFRSRSGIVQDPLTIRSGTIQEPFRKRSGAVQEPLNAVQEPFKVRSGAIQEPFRTVQEPFRNRSMPFRSRSVLERLLNAS